MEPFFAKLSKPLRIRLEAAGVVDEPSLQRALAADPNLQREYTTYLAEQRDALLQEAFDAFVTVPDSEALLRLIARTPVILSDEFIATVEQAMRVIEQRNDDGSARATADLRQRLVGVAQIRAQLVQDSQLYADQIDDALVNLATAQDTEDLQLIWQEIPLEAEESFFAAAEALATTTAQNGDAEAAARLRTHIAALRAVQAEQRAARETG